MKYVLLYDIAPEGRAKAPELYPAHAALSAEFARRGLLLWTGPFADVIKDGGMMIFKSREAAADFLATDPFVLNGVVSGSRILEWQATDARTEGQATGSARDRDSVGSTKYVLMYETATDAGPKIPVEFPGHVARNGEFFRRGLLEMTGPFADPTKDGAMAIFASREAAEEFVAGDPFVLNGVVGKWRVLEWKANDGKNEGG